MIDKKRLIKESQSRGNKRPSNAIDSSPNQRLKIKRIKTANARSIISQNSDASLENGKLDVAKFVQAREFEIQEFAKSMKRSKAIQKQQTFQSVPRSLRRRAASHHVHLLPPRFRKRALKEIQELTNPPLEPKKRRRITRLTLRRETALRLRQLIRKRKSYHANRKKDQMPVGINTLATKAILEKKFKRRQKDIVWLPTHLWHAKRAHLVKKWGYSIPNHPNDKCFRPTHRQSNSGSGVVFDTSYFGTIIILGTKQSLIEIVRLLTQSNACHDVFVNGQRAYEGPIYNSEEGHLIGECLVYFEQDKVIVRVHPAIYKLVWDTILTISRELQGSSDPSLQVQDCRFAIGSIDIFGPKSLRTITSCLPVRQMDSSWISACIAKDPKFVRPGTVFGLSFFDPRTVVASSRMHKFWMSDKYQMPGDIHAATNNEYNEFISSARESSSTLSPLFTIEGRKIKVEHSRLANDRFRKRKAIMNQIPDPFGVQHSTRKIPTFIDDVSIPGIVIRRQSGGLTVMLPWQWTSYFFKSLVIPGYTIFGGMRQYHQLLQERDLLYFPDDFPGTLAYAEQQLELATESEQKWQRRPKNRRVAYSSLRLAKGDSRGELGTPFASDWNFLLGSETPPWMISNLKQVSKNADRALFAVKLSMIGRGCPAIHARVYAIPRVDYNKWQAVRIDRKFVSGTENYPGCPPRDHLIGYVTTGGFNLRQGKGDSIASLSYAKVREFKLLENRYCVVRDVGETICRLASFQPISI
ncbi:ribonucleases P/MRP protein subunit POP1-domain-containing protein [Lipomyces oligophaga]|uniref:ribonucleases P/MRP protein subunit POP1-domain-containing protein n=1 Tax=Lipomyces oligophaga TaxID=45792 RepID=UPI0034CFDB06